MVLAYNISQANSVGGATDYGRPPELSPWMQQSKQIPSIDNPTYKLYTLVVDYILYMDY